ncbi:MAG: FtsX-like permease family protein [Angelakisella sp.]|nr:FtsX-like permease family protein [Angelakisella sp.]
MRYSALFKDIRREVTKTISRFLSIFAIVALGVGFFAGVQATGADMRLTADRYFDSHKLMDGHVISTLGLSQKDVDAVAKISGVTGVMPSHFTDAVALSSDNFLVRILSLPQTNTDSSHQLNQPRVIEGRLPQLPDECVIDTNIRNLYQFEVGRTITFAAGKKDENILDTLSRKSFRVVGVVESPMYIDMTTRGNTTIGNGSLNAFVLLPEEAFVSDYYTDLYVTYAPAAQAPAYSQEYDTAVEQLMDELTQLERVRAPARLEEVKAEANEEITKAEQELAEGKAEMEEKLAEAEQKMADAEEKLKEGEADYRQGLIDYQEEIGKAQQELNDAREKLDEGWAALREAREDLVAGQKELDAAKAQLKKGEEGYTLLVQNISAITASVDAIPDSVNGFSPGVPVEFIPGLTTLVDALNNNFTDQNGQSLGIGELLVTTVEIPNPVPEGEPIAVECVTPASKIAVKDALENYRVSTAAMLEMARKEIAAGEEDLAYGKQLYRESRQELEKGNQEYEEGVAKFEEEKAKAQQKLDDAKQQIEDGKRELAEGRAEYEEEKAKAEADIAEAEAKLADAKQELAELELPEWMVQSRTDWLPSYGNFGDDANRIDNVASVFPVFFLGVAALVCLTTMTRMVEEQRVQIGTAKALGYGGFAITSKYLSYAVIASFLGSLVGLGVGFKLFPTVIYNAYGIMYDMPPVVAPFWGLTGFVACSAAVLISAAVTLSACWGELRESPAQLMRPKAPKAGRRVLLERIPFVWRRLSFIRKVTVRNLFRYKKRVLMTITGIAGCTALMLTGFGLNDAISDIVRNQYVDIFRYDMMIFHNSDAEKTSLNTIRNTIAGEENIESWIAQSMETMTAIGKNDKLLDVNLVAVEEPEKLGEFITLRQRLDHKPLVIEPQGAVITEKMATLLELSVGDTLTVRDSDNVTHSLKVTGVSENYAHHFVYMTSDYYQQTFGIPAPFNSYLANLRDISLENAVAEELMGLEDVLGVSPTSIIKSDFGNISENFKFVVVVLIVSAGLLAFVVLYNLTNINITERMREIATLKVLGFYDKEVSAYIFRENTALTLMGAGVGLLLGIALTRFVVVTAEIDAIMFGRTIYGFSYLIAALLTMAFSAMVNFFMYFRLKKVNMVESMKSVD